MRYGKVGEKEKIPRCSSRLISESPECSPDDDPGTGRIQDCRVLYHVL